MSLNITTTKSKKPGVNLGGYNFITGQYDIPSGGYESQPASTSVQKPANETNIKPTSTGVSAAASASSSGDGLSALSNIGTTQNTTATPGVNFDANNYVSGMSTQELHDIMLYGANAATYDERQAISDAASALFFERQPTTSRPTNGMTSSGGGTWDGVWNDGSSAAGYSGTPSRGTNELPTPTGANSPLPGGPGVQDPTHPGVTDWNGANLIDLRSRDQQPIPPTPGQVPGGSPQPPTPGTGIGPPANAIPGAPQPAPGTGVVGPVGGAGGPTVPGPDSRLPNGGTQFNPGGGTNPSGTNPTVPQGNQNNGTAPSVYQLLPQGTTKYFQPNSPEGQWMQGLMDGSIDWSTLPPGRRDDVLAAIDAEVAADPDFFAKWGANMPDGSNNQAVQWVKNLYMERYGDPREGVRGSEQNTVNENGSVQGQYETPQGGAFQAISSDAAAMDDMGVERSDAAVAENNDRTASLDEMSSQQLNDILRQDSPLMQLARQDGVQIANRQGLRNSSLSAGAQMAQMTRQATPLAMQQADVENRTGLQNQQLESLRREANAGREQQNNQFNASSENAATSQEFAIEAARRDSNAGRQTQTSITNAGMANDILNADRQRELTYELQQLAGDQDYAKQGLAAQTAVDVANVEGLYKQYISDNDTAARMFDAYYDTVTQVLSTPDYTANEAKGRLSEARAEFEAGMEMILGFESFDLDNPVPGGGGSGTTEGSQAGEPSNNPYASQWDQLPPSTQEYFTRLGYTRDTWNPGQSVVDFP